MLSPFPSRLVTLLMHRLDDDLGDHERYNATMLGWTHARARDDLLAAHHHDHSSVALQRLRLPDVDSHEATPGADTHNITLPANRSLVTKRR